MSSVFGKTPAPEIAAGRLTPADYAANFTDLHPPLTPHEALVEADRCYFCYDAPCMNACPTSIDIPLFIRKIAGGNPDSAADTIFQSNILGGMCARVCPTETLCEEVCVRNTAEEKPVRIGLLQRHATDHYMAGHRTWGTRKPPTGKHIAVVGAGPAGLSCAHALACEGHEVTLYEARDKPGGLNEHGIATYKTVDDFAAYEVDFVLGVGGVTLKTGCRLGRDVTLGELRRDHDAVFLGLGLQAVNALGLDGEATPGVVDAVAWIESLRQAEDKSTVPVGRRVVVIGGGMTAVDAAVQAKKLGADEVTMVYRRGPEQMNASEYEREVAQVNGVTVRFFAEPRAISAANGTISAIEFETTRIGDDGRLSGTGERFVVAADQVMKAIGQTFVADPVSGADAPALDGRRIVVDAEGRTSLTGVWAGGDCVGDGEDLTVVAVDQGKRAALSINRWLGGAEAGNSHLGGRTASTS